MLPTILQSLTKLVIPEVVDYEVQDAAHVWAEARRSGKPFTADERLEGDVIFIAQVRALGDLDAVTVITENLRHLKPFVPTARWQKFEA